MKVIIVGAGEVGFISAETISDIHDVLVIDNDEDVADTLKARLNVSILREDGTNPRVLRYAIETHGADVIVSTLSSDSDNLFVCMMAKKIKPTIRTVASVDNPDFIIGTSSEGESEIDLIISPELITAEKMYKLCTLKNIVEYERIGALDVSVGVFRVEPHHPIVGRIVMHLPLPKDCTVFAIIRNDEVYTTPETMEIHAEDYICVFGKDETLTEFNDLVGAEDFSREFCILGGSIVGMNLAKLLADDPKKRYVKIIERDPERCRQLSRVLSGVVVINADFTDPDIQTDENVFKTDVTVSTSAKDDTNLLICMSARRLNATKVVSRFFKREYEDIFKYTGLDTIIGYDRIVSNEIIKCVVSDELAITRLQIVESMFFTHEVVDSSKLNGKFVGDLNLPEGLRIVAIERGGTIVYPSLDTQIGTDDSIILFSSGTMESDLVKILGKGALPEM